MTEATWGSYPATEKEASWRLGVGLAEFLVLTVP